MIHILTIIQNISLRYNMLKHPPEMNDEIHIKIGGDHGGHSFKACYQVLNRECPNNKDNTCVFSLFEAKDYRTNLVTGLHRYRSQIDDLQETKWE